MIKKTLIISLILCGFLVASISTVLAADEEKSFTDPEDDVYDINIETTDTKPNIDIVSIDYAKEGKEVTLILTVKGTIENKGDITILENMEEESLNFVSYTISLYTTLEHTYDIIYINEDYNFTIDAEEVTELTDFSYEGSTLTFIFDLKNQDERYTALEVSAVDMSSTELYVDDYIDMIEELDVEIVAPSTGKVGQSIEFSADVSGGDSYGYEWDFDEDLTTDSTAENPTHTYDEAGTYDVTLFVIDSEDKQGYASTTITISEDGTTNGGNNNDKGQEDSNSAILLFAAIIAIIVIIGVVVVVVIIRR